MRKLQGLLLIALFATPLIYQPTFYQVLKLRTFDRFIETPDRSGYFAILNITEEDVNREGGYPLSRVRLGEIQVELLRKGATGVGWVIGFPHPDRVEHGDKFFAETLGYGPSVLAMFEHDNGQYPDTVGTVIKGEEVGGYTAKGTIQNIDILKDSYWTEQGIASAPVEADNLVRRIPLLYRTPDGWLASFGTQVLKIMAEAKTYIIKTNQNGIEEVVVQGLPPVKVDSLGRKWVSWIVPRETTLQEMDVDGKFVFVGVTAKGVMPQVATPIGLLEPHYIQAALAESMLVENSPYIPDYALAVEFVMYAVTVGLVWLLIGGLGITWGVLLASVVFSATAYAGVQFIANGLLIDVIWALITQILASTVAFYLNYRTQYRLRQQIKTTI